MYPHRPFVTASVSSELILPSDRRGWPPCSEQTKQSEHLFALFGVHEGEGVDLLEKGLGCTLPE